MPPASIPSAKEGGTAGAERAAELGVTVVGLNKLFAECPVVSVQAPATEETYHMIGAEQLKLLPDGACFVNTARSWPLMKASSSARASA